MYYYGYYNALSTYYTVLQLWELFYTMILAKKVTETSNYVF